MSEGDQRRSRAIERVEVADAERRTTPGHPGPMMRPRCGGKDGYQGFVLSTAAI